MNSWGKLKEYPAPIEKLLSTPTITLRSINFLAELPKMKVPDLAQGELWLDKQAEYSDKNDLIKRITSL
tara:strand:- start:431 stop:637 length:207 start_codon:yes stop_codon:yes gene_type:complete